MMVASGVLTSWATPAATSPIEASLADWMTCASNCLRSVMSCPTPR
ncbi:MAG: hypothetical protein VX610_06170 [SAR324 cluster bacterium]|nr:hypothetical protein [SAR324 cluster bacterium]